MRIIAQNTLVAFWDRHPESRVSLERWITVMKEHSFTTTAEVQARFSKAKVLNGERVRFEIHGGDYRLIAAFKFKNKIVYVKFVGTHAEYDRVDAVTVSLF